MVAKNSGDVEKIFIDKSLCGKVTEKINTGGNWAYDLAMTSQGQLTLCGVMS